jgi:predicted transcriptional regulator of viral defense system
LCEYLLILHRYDDSDGCLMDKLDFLKILKTIEENQLLFFTSSDLAAIFGVEAKSLQNYLETLANNELVHRIEKGKYCRTYLKDKWVLGTNLVAGGVISYNTALVHHGLIQDVSREVFVASDRQKSNKTIFGYNFRFIKIRSRKYFGFIEEKNDFGKFRVTDLEKTILDCFDLPQYTLSYSVLVSLFGGIELDENKLLNYGIKMGNLSVLKRLGFLSDSFSITGLNTFKKKVTSMLNEKYTLLNPSGPDCGPFCPRWKIRNNMI